MPEPHRVPEIYADFVRIVTGELGTFLGILSIKPMDLVPSGPDDSDGSPEMPSELKAVVRLGQTQAKMFAILLKRSLKDYEQDAGNIPLPSDFADQLDMSSDEW
jgi:hypothetical protein